MSNAPADFLNGQTAVATAKPIWKWQGKDVPLHEQTYLSPTLPPDELISSARAILFRGNEVMVIRDHQNEPYIVPGGRREPGETVLETLHREIREETGWSIRDTAVLGFVHFQHLSPKPANYPYPYPNFVQAIFTARATIFDDAAIEEDAYVTSSSFQPITEVINWKLNSGQIEMLETAVSMLGKVDQFSTANR